MGNNQIDLKSPCYYTNGDRRCRQLTDRGLGGWILAPAIYHGSKDECKDVAKRVRYAGNVWDEGSYMLSPYNILHDSFDGRFTLFGTFGFGNAWPPVVTDEMYNRTPAEKVAAIAAKTAERARDNERLDRISHMDDPLLRTLAAGMELCKCLDKLHKGAE